MDAAQRVMCGDPIGDLDVNPILTLGIEVSCLLVVSHIFQLILKPLGQPGPIAQILGGLVLGRSGLSHFQSIKRYFLQDELADYHELMALLSRMMVMFVIGLETDVPHMARMFRPAIYIAFGGIILCSIFALAVFPFVYQETESHGDKFVFAILLMLSLSNATSPIVIRFVTELKFATTDVGRLAMTAALINDISCLLVLGVIAAFTENEIGKRIGMGISAALTLVVIIVINKYLSSWLNQRNRNQKYLKNAEIFFLLSLIAFTASVVELYGFDSSVACFLLGLMFPRRGKTARTLMHKLSSSVSTFVLPIYFGYLGFKADVTQLKGFLIIMVVIIMLLSIGGKIGGTLMACRRLLLPLGEGVVFAFLLCMKGNVDLLIVRIASTSQQWGSPTVNMWQVSVVLTTLIVGPIVALIVGRDRKCFGYIPIPLELQGTETELRILACVHSPRYISPMVGLIAASRGSTNATTAQYLLHLIELRESREPKNLMYHQQEDDLSDDEYYAGNDVVQITDAIDVFTTETGILIQPIKEVTTFGSMYEEVCDRAEDIHASIILLPFHKHQRIDGKMETAKEGVRITNQKVLRHAPCSVGILVERGLPGESSIPTSESIRDIAVLFFGGPDDREALAYGTRLGIHPFVNLTVIRFSPASSRDPDLGSVLTSTISEDILLSTSSNETETELDNAFLADFYNRYVTTGQMGYVEKFANDGSETVTALRDIGDMYSLFIVGKGGRGFSPLTTGMSDWEECPEIGTVGDILASSDLDITGSVLVIQQHRNIKKIATNND
ncbi:Cation/H+ exchanger [Dillenia turbinata]|uniref:Cation/H+ exchanger n=1 Tax=Dillenia turbinata TaxID=194707 RepID=A0AAN8VC05_9MAGN